MRLGPYQTNPDVTATALAAQRGDAWPRTPAQRDQTINPGTLGLWDFASLFGAPGGYTPVSPLVQNTPMANLVVGGSPMLATPDTTVADITYEDGGIKFAGSVTSFYAYLEIPDVTPEAGLMLTAWIKSTYAGADGFNTRLMAIGGLLEVVPTVSGGVATTYEVTSPNALSTVVPSADLRAALNDGNVHQIAHYVEPRGGGNYRMVTFLDRVRIYEGADYALGAPAAGLSYLGNRGARTITGSFYRCRVDQVGDAMMTADDIIAADWDANYARLAAL